MSVGGLSLITRRQWSQHRLRLLLTVLGIALGVAVYFAVQTTNTTLARSLNSTVEKLAGKATLQLSSGDVGFDEAYLDMVRRTPGVALAEPVTEVTATSVVPANEKLRIVGLDTSSELKMYSDMFEDGGFSSGNTLAFASRSDSIAVSRKFADRFSLKENDKLSVRTRAGTSVLTIRAVYSSIGVGEVFDGNVAVMDLFASQETFGRGGRIDRIDIMSSPGVDVDELKARIAAQLPVGITVARPELRGKSLENSVSTLHFGLRIMSFLAFVICSFLIFNSFSIALSQRWRELGILRAIGVTSRGVQLMFLGEAVVIGLIGSTIGVAGGYLLSILAIRVVTRVSEAVYGLVASPAELEFDLGYAGWAFAGGIAVSLISAWLPARAAAQLDPVETLHNVETRTRRKRPKLVWSLVGFTLVGTGLGLVAFGTPMVGLNTQLFYTLLIQAGMIFLVPLFILVGARLLRPFMNVVFGAEGLIAVETLARAPRRTAATVGALMVGLGFVFSNGSFIISQKAAINRSIDKSVNADVLVTASEQLQSSAYHFPQETADQIRGLPEVALSDPLRIATTKYDGRDVTILAHDMDAHFAISPDLLDHGDPARAREITSRGEGVLVSSNFGLRWNVSLGDHIRIDAPGGSFQLPVVGMLDSYRSENGTIFLDRSLFRKYWGDNDVDYIFIDLKPNTDLVAFKQKVRDLIAGQQSAFIYTHDEYKQWVGRLIDQFFMMMYLHMVVAIFVAALGLANTMIISVEQRRRELGIFRAVGGTRRQVIKMVLLEAGAISLIGLAAGAVSGVFNSYFLVHTAATVVAGFNVRLVFPYAMVAIALPLVIVVALFAAVWPALKAARLNVVEAIGHE